MNGTSVAQSPNIYFTIQAKLDAIAAVKRGERRMKVAHKLGITGDVLTDWLASLAHHDWLNGTQRSAVSGSDILDRAVYTWYIQQLKADIHPTKEEVNKKADVFAMRLNKSPGHVNGAWVQDWLYRHDIVLRDSAAPKVSEAEIEEEEREDKRLKEKRRTEMKQTPEKRAIPPAKLRKRPSSEKQESTDKVRTYSRAAVPKTVVNGFPDKEEKMGTDPKRPRTDSSESFKENVALNHENHQLLKDEKDPPLSESKLICEFDLKTLIDGIIQITMKQTPNDIEAEFFDRVNDRLGCVEVQCKFVDSIYKRLGKFPNIYHRSGLYTQKVSRAAELKKKQLSTPVPKGKNQPTLQKFDSNNHHTPAKNEIIFSGANKLERRHLPPFGPVRRPDLKVNSLVYAAKTNSLSTWLLARVLETKVGAVDGSTNPVYKVRFEHKRNALVRLCPPKLMAYAEPPSVTLPVGTRIVARYKEDTGEYHTALYAGIIAEPPKVTNNLRYLVFFDDGYAQYVRHFEVFLVCSPKKEVWEDINHQSRDFIRQYLNQYPERPMVRLLCGQRVNTEWNGEWWQAVVSKVDASLVEMYFEADKRSEWIYRGSTRLEPLFRELLRVKEIQESGKHTKRHNVNFKRKDRPYVEYTRSNDDDERPASPEIEVIDDVNGDFKKQMARKQTGGVVRQVARKSTTQGGIIKNVGPYQPIPNRPHVIDPNKALSQMGNTETYKMNAKRITYLPHRCMNRCLGKEDMNAHRGQNPLRIPMLCGWQREIAKFSVGCKRQVFYRAVCGRRLRNMDEVARYLRTTNSKLTVDLFSFDIEVHTFNQFKPAKILFFLKDVTAGHEPVPVCCVNSLSPDGPPYLAYSATRFTAKGVTMNLDPEFLCGCDCVDDCQNRETCQCQQLTVTATSALLPEPNKNAGYKHRRLMESLTTGIYECNSRCRCKRTCVNRVAQNGLQVRLQMFKTEQRGWGIRCLDDIPQGMFICIYAGQLLSEQEAIEQGQTFGDEYQAELDHIEVVETCKEGYEADVIDDEDFNKNKDTVYKPIADSVNSSDSDSDFEPNSLAVNGFGSNADRTISTRKRNGRTSSNEVTGDSDSNNSGSNRDLTNGKSKETKLSSSFGFASNRPVDKPEKEPRKSMRQTYFNEEYCYIMDAKNKGNIGRFLNHSCNPNVFVQNVFVDTHDLRFPWVAFFASCFIRAGKELTWDYSYEIGSVQGKVMWCYCGSAECRGRLL